ncbi:hypothetical protein [Paraburkholderia sabiae]|uniref:hypothetical protein n=1 Tax=Paraburkholderia sabiae TaxID=273251 RepID=UPI001CC6945B|nr:hypothetical protein [Paraburkholderia sabiae]
MKRLSFAYFSLPLQRKVGAAPHRGNACSTDTKTRMPQHAQKNPPKHRKFREETCERNGTAGQFRELLLQLTRKNGVSFAATAASGNKDAPQAAKPEKAKKETPQ